MTRACGSPKIPVTVGLGEKPGKRYESQRRRFRWRVGMRSSCALLSRPQGSISPAPHLASTQKPHKFTHSIGRRPSFLEREKTLFLEMELREKHPNLHLVPVIGDIVDVGAVERVFREYAPSRIYHAAAYKHVPMMECNPHEAVRNNVVGTWRVAEAAGRHGVAKFVLVSTDKAVWPVSVMGVTKRLAELVMLELQERFTSCTRDCGRASGCTRS